MSARFDPCTHPRCLRADEGECFYTRLLAQLADLGAFLTVEEIGDRWHVRATFGNEAEALTFRDIASLRLAEAGLDYFFPSLATNGRIWEVTLCATDGDLTSVLRDIATRPVERCAHSRCAQKYIDTGDDTCWERLVCSDCNGPTEHLIKGRCPRCDDNHTERLRDDANEERFERSREVGR